MTPLSDALTTAQRRAREQGWYAKLQDANLSEDEFARWQRLQVDGLSAATALAVVLRGRVGDPPGME